MQPAGLQLPPTRMDRCKLEPVSRQIAASACIRCCLTPWKCAGLVTFTVKGLKCSAQGTRLPRQGQPEVVLGVQALQRLQPSSTYATSVTSSWGSGQQRLRSCVPEWPCAQH